MIDTIIQSIKSKITSLPFVEVFGGLAVPVSKYDEVCDKNGSLIGSKITTLPVTCGMGAINCFSNGKYQDLVPNSSRASIFYFEELSGLRFFSSGKFQKGIYEFKGKIRLIGWLNLQKLGHTDKCTIAPQVHLMIIKALYGECNAIAPLDNGKIKFSNFSIVPNSTNLFSKYSYSQDVQLNMFPYETIGIDMDVTIAVGPSCVEEYTNGIEVECLDLTEV